MSAERRISSSSSSSSSIGSSTSTPTAQKPAAPPADCKKNCSAMSTDDCKMCRTSAADGGGGACPAVKQNERCIAMCGSLKSQCGRQHDASPTDPVLLNRMCWQHQMAMMGQFDTDAFDPDSGVGVAEGERVAAMLPQLLSPASPTASAILDNALQSVMNYARQPDVWETLYNVRAEKLKRADTDRRKEARSAVYADIRRDEDQTKRDYAIKSVTDEVCRYMQKRNFSEQMPPHLWVRAFMMSVRTRLAADRSRMRSVNDQRIVDGALSSIRAASNDNDDNESKIMRHLETAIVEQHKQCMRQQQKQQ